MRVSGPSWSGSRRSRRRPVPGPLRRSLCPLRLPRRRVFEPAPIELYTGVPEQDPLVSNSKKPVKVALLGCGTVGGGVVRLISGDDGRLAEHIGAPIEIAHVLVRDPSKARVPGLNPALVTPDANAVLSDDSIDVVVELIGGEEPALG